MKHKVRALGTYKELNISDKVLNKIVEVGTEFEVDDDRLDVLLGNNKFNRPFVEVVKGVKVSKDKGEPEPEEEMSTEPVPNIRPKDDLNETVKPTVEKKNKGKKK